MSSARTRSVGLFAALVLATLAVGHHLIYLIAHGHDHDLGHALSVAGHDAYWAGFLVVVGGAAAITLGVAVHQLRRLASIADSTPSGAVVTDAGIGRLVDAWRPVFAKVSVATTVAFLVQENLERASVGDGFPGIGVVTGDHAIAIPALLVVAAVVSLVRALVRWRRDVLLARIRHGSRPRRAAADLWSVVDVLPLVSADGGGSNGTRAPPLAAHARA